MNNRPTTFQILRNGLRSRAFLALRKSLFVLPALALAAGSAQAASKTWDPSTTTTGSNGSGTWTNGSGAIWASGGSDSTFATTDDAIVGVAGGSGTYTISIAGAGVTANSLTLNAAGTGTYTFTTGTITLTSATNALVVNNSATFNDTLVFSNAAAVMSFATAGQTITLNGTGTNSIGNYVSGTTAAIAQSSELILSSSGSYTASSGNTSMAGLSIGNAGTIGTNPGTATPTSGIYLTSGTLTASSQPVTIGGSNAGGANGLMTVNGGFLNVSGAGILAIGNNQSAAQSARLVLNTGTVTVSSGVLMNYNTTTGGGDELDINGGTFTSNSAVSLQAGNVTGGQSMVDITGGTATMATVAFGHNGYVGAAALGGSSTFKLEGGTLYIGEGGIFNGGTGTSTYALNLSGGTLAATSDWVSSLNMGVANTLTIQAANASSGAQNIVLSGALTGTGGIIKTGAGFLKLSGANNYTGTTAVNVGTLQIGNEVSFYNGTINATTAAKLSVAASATLDLNVGGSGEFTAGDVGTIVGNSSLASGSTLALDTTDAVASNFTLSNSLSGSYNLTKLGTGTMTVTGANLYTGTTTINGGTLDLGGSTANGSIASGSPLVLGGGALSYTRTGGTTQTFNGLTLNAGTSTVTTVAGDTVALGAITRNAGSTVNFGSAGTVTTTNTTNTNGILGGYALFGGNTWAVAPASSGGAITGLSTFVTTTTAGTTASNYTNANIDVTSSTGTLGGAITPNSIRFNQAAADTVTLATGNSIIGTGGILVTSAVGANTSTITGGTKLEGSSGGNLIINQNNASGVLNINSVIADNTSATALVKAGSGTLGLSGSNTYTGVTYLDGGVVVLNNANALNTAALSGGISFDGGSIRYGTATTDYSSKITNSTGTISVDLNGNSITWASGLSASNTGGLTVFDTSGLNTGVLILSNASGTAFTGNISIITGTLETTSTSSTQPAFGSNTNTILLGDATPSNSHNATLDIGASGPEPANAIIVEAGSSGTLTIEDTANAPVAFLGTVALNNNLTVQNSFSSRLIVFTNTVTEGSGALTISNGATVGGTRFDGNIVVGSGGLTLVNNGTANGTGGTGLFQVSGGVTGTGNLTLNNTTSLANGIALTATRINNTGTITNMGVGSDLISASVGANVLGIVQNSGTLQLSGSNTAYTGLTTINAGTLALQSATALNSADVVGVASGGTLDIQNVSDTIAGLNNVSGSGGTVTDTTATGVNTLTLGGSGAYSFSGVITATTVADMALKVALTGSGSQTLSGTNTYTGATSVNLGTLALSNGGSLAGTAVTVGNATVTPNVSGNATLLIEGNDTIGSGGAGTLTIKGGNGTTAGQGTLSLVDGTINTLTLSNSTVGTNILTLGNATASNPSILDLEVGSTSDKIAISSGKLSVLGAVTVNITGLGSLSGTQQTLISSGANSGTAFTLSGTGFNLAATTGNFSGYTVSLANDSSTNGHDLYLNEVANATPSAAYWYGGASAVTAQGGTSAWNSFANGNTDTSNFTTDAGGTTNAAGLVGSVTNVNFNALANVVAGSYTNTTLGQNFTINSLNINTGGVGIASGAGGPYTLTINAGTSGGNTLGNGITTTGSGNNTISAPIALGASQTWTIASTGTGGALTVSGTVSGTGFALTKSGTGTLALSGNNTYSGGTTVSTGTLVVGASTTVTGSVIASGAVGTGTLTLTNGTTLQDNGTAIVLANALSLNGTITFSSTGAGSLDFDGTTLSTPSQVTLAGATTLIVTNTITIADTINYGSNTLTKTGAGTLYLTGNNSASTQNTTVSTGTLTLSAGNSLGSGTTVNLANGTTLQFNGTSSSTLNQNVTVTGTNATINNATANVLTLSGTLTKNGTTLNITGGKNVISGAIVGSLANSDVNYNGHSTTGLTGTASTYNGPTTISGTSTLLTGVSNALPTPSPYTALTLGAGSDVASSVNTLDLLGTSQTVASITATGAGTNQIISSNGSATTPAIGSGASTGTGNLTVNVTGTTTDTYTGLLGDSNVGAPTRNANNFSLTKSGTGTLALTNANTYAGGTTITAGTLIVSNTSGSATGTGGLVLNSGATLSGTGTISGTGNATISGTVAVGNGGINDVLHMTMSGTTTFSSASLTFSLGSGGTSGQSSVLDMGNTNSILFTGTDVLTLNIVGTLGNIPSLTQYTLFTETGGGTGGIGGSAFGGSSLTYNSGTGVISGLTLNFEINGVTTHAYDGSYLILTGSGGTFNIVAVVPEPSTWILMLSGLALLVILQRRRRQD